MDLDDDFVVGETEDATACDDITGSSGPNAEDVDGDTVTEAQIYVDSSSGVNDASCGGAGDPCATVSYAISNRMGTQAGEDYICVKGTFQETVTPAGSGDAGTKTKTASGNEVYDFQYPSNPNVLMGWDYDQDNEYPPYDTDDTAVFDGNGRALDDWVRYPNSIDRWEFAHVTVTDYDDSMIEGSGGAGVSDHVYWHDIYGYEINYAQDMGSGDVFLYSLWGQDFTYHAVENVTCYDCMGYAMRGSGATTNNYLRIRNTSITWYGTATGQYNKVFAVKMWGPYTYVEIIDNYWDATNDDWDTDQGDQWPAIAFNTCVRDAYAINNYLKNFGTGFNFEPGDPAGCTSRRGDNLNFLRNEVYSDDANETLIGVNGFMSGASETVWHEDLTIANNIFYSSGSQHRICLYGGAGSQGDPTSYTFAFINNTCYSSTWDVGYFALNVSTSSSGHKTIIKNNIVAGHGSGASVYTIGGTISSQFESDYNVIELSNAKYNYGACSYCTSWSTFISATGEDANSDTCAVSFANEATDLHLDSGDTCALGQGTSVSAYITDDYDGDSRPQDTTWDIGADEYYDSGSVTASVGSDSLTLTGQTPTVYAEYDYVVGVGADAFVISGQQPYVDTQTYNGTRLLAVTAAGVEIN